jgi:hypothetical protein
VLLALIATCCVVAWLVRGWLYPNRIPGQHIALIGPMDIDRDCRDDRARLAMMIVRNGGVVDYDLPVVGLGSGRIGLGTSWYVEGTPMRGTRIPAPFLKARAVAVSQARENGVRPISIEKLIAKLEGK